MNSRHDWHHVMRRVSGIATVPLLSTSNTASGATGRVDIEIMATRRRSKRRPQPHLRLRHYACNEDTNPIRPIVGNFETQ